MLPTASSSMMLIADELEAKVSSLLILVAEEFVRRAGPFVVFEGTCRKSTLLNILFYKCLMPMYVGTV